MLIFSVGCYQTVCIYHCFWGFLYASNGQSTIFRAYTGSGSIMCSFFNSIYQYNQIINVEQQNKTFQIIAAQFFSKHKTQKRHDSKQRRKTIYSNARFGEWEKLTDLQVWVITLIMLKHQKSHSGMHRSAPLASCFSFVSLCLQVTGLRNRVFKSLILSELNMKFLKQLRCTDQRSKY